MATRSAPAEPPTARTAPAAAVPIGVVEQLVTDCYQDIAITEAEYATTGWLDWYNSRRLHGTLGHVPPIDYENAHYASLTQQSEPA